MSELKRCPLCNSEFELDTDKRFYIHPLVGCYFDCLIIKADNENSIKKWNTRKPLERIVERLEDTYQDRIDCAYHTSDCFVDGQADGLYKALSIVKEEGGMNEKV